MGMRDFLEKMKQQAEERLNPKPLTPEQERARKAEEAKKTFKRTAKAMELGQKAIKISKDVGDKTDALKDAAAKVFLDVTDKSAPLADKVDGLAGKLKKAVNGPDDGTAKPDRPKKTSGSGLLDLLVPPADHDATKKPAADPAPKAPKPPRKK